MRNAQRARNMRAAGLSFAAIAAALDIHPATAYRHAGDVSPGHSEDAATVVRRHAHNGGCSTLSGMMPIRMPRIAALHGSFAQVAP